MQVDHAMPSAGNVPAENPLISRSDTYAANLCWMMFFEESVHHTYHDPGDFGKSPQTIWCTEVENSRRFGDVHDRITWPP